MSNETLAPQLASRTRIGMTEELAEQLGMKSEEAVRSDLDAMVNGKHGPVTVHLLGVYVIDDTDFWSDGEIYWWSIPTLEVKGGGVIWNSLSTLPNGAPPHKCGDLEWLTNVALKDPPVLAVIPPSDDVNVCAVKVAVYDDDGAVADFPKAMGAGYAALAQCKSTGLTGSDSITGPVREAIFKTLKGDQDDILVEQDLVLRRDDARYGVGFIGSFATTKARVYYFVKDEQRTITMGPLVLKKDESATIKPDQPAVAGGAISLFARGAAKKVEVTCGVFGSLTTEKPFIGHVLSAAEATALNNGLAISTNADVSIVAYYTPLQ